MKLKFKQLSNQFILPTLATDGSAGMDLYAAKGGIVHPGEIAKIPLGFAVEIPPGHALFITARSGHGVHYGAGVPHGYGLIDSDYRGQVYMVLTVTEPNGFGWRTGDRIGQMVLMPVIRPELEIVDELSDTARGTGGFGHTGVA